MSLSVAVPPSPTSTTIFLNYRHSNFLPKTNYPCVSFYKHVTLSGHNSLQSVTNDILSTRAVGRCEFIDLHRELVPYDKAWDMQKAIVKQKKSLIERNEECCDTLIVLQHHPVYTLGTGSSDEYLNFNINNAPLNVFRTERGGEVTYHGPGQLVMYPIINLRNHKMDLHWYLRALEEVVIRLLATTFSIKASRLEGFTGVWVGDKKKLAAVGIRVSQWIAYHGLALNVSMDLSPFQQIVPCGLRDRGVGSIKGVLQEHKCHAAEDLVRVTDDDYTLLEIAHDSLIREFCQVFQLRLEPVSVSMSL